MPLLRHEYAMLTQPQRTTPIAPELSHIRSSLAGTLSAEREENTYAAVALVLAGEAADLSLCLIRRAEHELDRWSGHVALPGGRVDPVDASPRHAAIRETREEVGLRLERSPCLGSLGPRPINRDGRPSELSLSSYVFYLGETLEPFEPSDEVAEAFWVPLAHLLDRRNAGNRPTSRNGRTYDSPSVIYQGHHVWGLTYRILTQFFEGMQLRIARPAK